MTASYASIRDTSNLHAYIIAFIVMVNASHIILIRHNPGHYIWYQMLLRILDLLMTEEEVIPFCHCFRERGTGSSLLF